MGQRWLAGICLVLVGSAAVFHVAAWPTRLRYPGELALVEGLPLAEMVRMAKGVEIYVPATPDRFDAPVYGPLYYLLGAKLVDPIKPAYRPLRALSLAATLGCAGACALLAFWLSRSVFAAFLAPLLYLSFRIVTSYSVSARSDAVALLLVLSGFLVAYRSRHSRGILWAVPLFLTSFFYKQQYIAAPAAVFVYLCLEKQYRRAAEFGGLITAGGLALLAFFEFYVFRGGAFFGHFIVFNMIGFSARFAALGILFFGLLLLVPLLVGLEFLRLHPDRILICYLACAVLMALIGMARIGSEVNYNMECMFLVSALFAALVAERAEKRLLGADLVLLTLAALFLGQWLALPNPGPGDFQSDQRIQSYLRESFPAGTPALGFYSGDLVRAGLDTPVPDVVQYWVHHTDHRLCDGFDLAGLVRARRFGVIITRDDMRNESSGEHLAGAVREEVAANYRPACTLELPEPQKFAAGDRFYAWVPKRRGGTLPPPPQR